MSLTEATSPSAARPAPAPVALPDIEIAPQPTRPQRLASLDIFRGITIAAMLLVNNPGSWSHVYGPLRHADWHGWTPTDLIFPFFLFIVGVAIPFSLSKRSAQQEASRGSLLIGIWSRSLALVMLGLLLHALPYGTFDALDPQFKVLTFLRVATYWTIGVCFVLLLFPWPSRKLSNLFPPLVAVVFAALYVSIYFANKHALEAGLANGFNFGNGIFTPWKLRLPGVLQRIGICYGVAATIALFAGGWRMVLGAAVFFMTVYCALMFAAPYGDDHEVGSLTKEDNLARKIDEHVFNRYEITPEGERRAVVEHAYHAYPDPEGILSTLPAIGTVLLGILVGLGLRHPTATPPEKCARLLAWGVFATIAGVLLGWWLMPINKPIWTPSFTVFTAGMGMLGLGAIYYVADVRGRRLWALPFTIYGMNAIAAFVFSGILVRIANIVRVGDVTLIEWCKMQVAEGMHRLEQVAQQVVPQLAPIDTPHNISLAYALAFVLAIFILMALMYVCRIFLKV